MYRTPKGDRILLGAERDLFEESLGMMVDLLSGDDCQFGVRLFDDLQRGQKLFALYRVARALLVPEETSPEHAAFAEATAATVYRHVFDLIVREIDDPEFAASQPSWRRLASQAARECDDIEQWPDESSQDKGEWEAAVECLADQVLRDRDYELELHLDAAPDASQHVKEIMGVPEDYYTAVPDDPPDDQLNLYVDALKGLTPRGRGSSLGEDQLPPDSEFF